MSVGRSNAGTLQIGTPMSLHGTTGPTSSGLAIGANAEVDVHGTGSVASAMPDVGSDRLLLPNASGMDIGDFQFSGDVSQLQLTARTGSAGAQYIAITGNGHATGTLPLTATGVIISFKDPILLKTA